MRTRSAVAVVAVGLAIAATATGITYAATSSSGGTVHACADAKGVLALLNSHGHCPAHFVKVAISERGPRGKAGPRGPAGPAGPGAIRLAVHSTNGLVTKESKKIAGSTLTVEVLCDPAGDAQVYINADAVGAAWTFEGNASWNGVAGSATLLYENPNGTPVPIQQIGQTTKVVAGSQGTDAHSVEFTASADTLEADVLVNQGSHMFSVQLGAFVASDDSSCWSHAMVTPVG